MTARWKTALSRIIPRPIWNTIRERKIIHKHAQTAAICHELIGNYLAAVPYPGGLPIIRKKDLKTEKIIWQYWAQGFDNVPSVVQECLGSVDRWKGEYTVIRLHNGNISDYLAFPEYIQAARQYMSTAYFSDLLRICLLSVYGGLWLDATVLLSGPIPEYISSEEYFLYQRDPVEKNKTYWENAYAYYFGWAKGYRVNMLSSIFYSKKNGELVKSLCGVMLYYWKLGNTKIPDYFFLQILYDVLVNNPFNITKCRVISDCKPHFLQQYLNDPAFNLATKEEILRSTSLHKLTYK